MFTYIGRGSRSFCYFACHASHASNPSVGRGRPDCQVLDARLSELWKKTGYICDLCYCSIACMGSD